MRPSPSLADFSPFKNGSPFHRAAFLLTMLGGLALLSGCRSLPAPHSLPHRPAEAALIPASMAIPLPDGAAAPTRLYQPATSRPRGVILAFHGFGDSRDAWEVMAPPLTRAGYLIVAPDVRGFGGFPTWNDWSSTQRMVADGVAEARWCQQHWSGLPLAIMGESMGGALALLVGTTMQKAPPEAPPLRLILLAPAIMTIGEPWQTLLEGWNLLTPHAALTGAVLPGHHVATRNIRALRRFFFDPLTRHGTNVHALRGLVRLMARADRQARQLHTPALLLWGDRDQFVPATATLHLIHHAPSGSLRLDELPQGYHLISREPDDRPARDILSWLEDPTRFFPSGGDSAASAWLWLQENR